MERVIQCLGKIKRVESGYSIHVKGIYQSHNIKGKRCGWRVLTTATHTKVQWNIAQTMALLSPLHQSSSSRTTKDAKTVKKAIGAVVGCQIRENRISFRNSSSIKTMPGQEGQPWSHAQRITEKMIE